MNMALQISRRLGRTTGARTRSAADYSITATISVVPDPLDPENCAEQHGDYGRILYALVIGLFC